MFCVWNGDFGMQNLQNSVLCCVAQGRMLDAARKRRDEGEPVRERMESKKEKNRITESEEINMDCVKEINRWWTWSED